MSEPAWSEDQLTSVLLSTLDAEPDYQEDLSRYQQALDAFTNSKTLEELERENEYIWIECQAQSSTVDPSDLDKDIEIPSAEELISRYNWTHADIERGYKAEPAKFQYFEDPSFDDHEEVDVVSVFSAGDSNAMSPTNSPTDGLFPETAISISSSPASTSTIASMSTPTDVSMLSETGTGVSSFTRAGSMIAASSLSDSSQPSESATDDSSSPSSASSVISMGSSSDASQPSESAISISSSPAESTSNMASTSTPSDSSELPEPAMSVDSSPAQSTRATGPANSRSDPNQLPAPAIITFIPAQSIRPMLLANYPLNCPSQRPLPDLSTYPPPEGTLAPMDILLDPTKLRAPFTFRSAAQLSQTAPVVDLPTRPAQLPPPSTPAQQQQQQQPPTPAAPIVSSPAPHAQTVITTPSAPGAPPSPLVGAQTPTVPASESPCVARAGRKRRAAVTVTHTPAPDHRYYPELEMGLERFLLQAFPDEITPLQKRRVLNTSPLGERIRYCRPPTADMAYGGRTLSVRSLQGMIFAARLAEARRVAMAARVVKSSARGGVDKDVTMVDVQPGQ